NGSTVVYSNTSVSNVTINDLGPDANVPGNELFSVTYATGWLPDSYFNLAWAVQLGGRVPSDCPDIEPFVQGLTPYTPTSFEYPLTTPCNRIDTIWGATSSNPFRFYGEDPTGTCTNSGFVYPSLQQIEYNINGVWYGESQTMDSLIRDTAMSYYLPPTGGPFSNFLTSKFGLVDPYGSLELQIDITKRTSGHGKMYIRTRNIVYNKPLSQYGGQWPIPKFVGTNQNCCVSPWSSLYTYSY
ncbi:MAG: hypothetical protein JST13_15120, partial [Bacteroidetes bacterium]|nr:hypothetical protein [Bacteroidota bacterium]